MTALIVVENGSLNKNRMNLVPGQFTVNHCLAADIFDFSYNELHQ